MRLGAAYQASPFLGALEIEPLSAGNPLQTKMIVDSRALCLTCLVLKNECLRAKEKNHEKTHDEVLCCSSDMCCADRVPR